MGEPTDDRLSARNRFDRNNPTQWFESLYSEAQGDASSIPWADLAANPNLVSWLDRQAAVTTSKRAMVVGCGLGDDAQELARRGYAVSAFDISSTAIDWCRRRFPDSLVEYIVADLLDLSPQWRRSFDLVVESYTLQALPPDLRTRAVSCVADLVRPGGTLLVICRGRDEADPVGELPWPLTKGDLKKIVDAGLTERSVEDYWDQERPPVRRFRAVYARD